jgi:hypothetical protein
MSVLRRFVGNMAAEGIAAGPSSNLAWSEMGCRDGSPYPEQWRSTRGRDLGIVFDRIRSIWNKPIIVASVYRTATYNKKIGGAGNSQHTHGRAMDLYPPKGVPLDAFQNSVRELADRMLAEGKDLIGGIGYYPWGVHVDIRGGIGDKLIVWWGKRPAAEVITK